MVSEKLLNWLHTRLRVSQIHAGRALTQCRSTDPAERLLGILAVGKFNRSAAYWRRKIKEVTAAN